MTDEPTLENTVAHIPIQVIEKRNKARVVQYRASDGGLRRCILPARVVREALAGAALAGDGLTEEELERGIPYGEDWVAMLEGVTLPTPEMVAQALRDAGIWTAEQARANVSTTRAAVATVYVPLTTAILRGSRAVQKARR